MFLVTTPRVQWQGWTPQEAGPAAMYSFQCPVPARGERPVGLAVSPAPALGDFTWSASGKTSQYVAKSAVLESSIHRVLQ